MSLSGFGIRVMSTSQNELENISSFAIFHKAHVESVLFPPQMFYRIYK